MMRRSLSILLLCLLAAPLPAAEVVVLGLFKDFAVLEVDGKRYRLRRGESTPEGIRLVSADSEQAVLEMDGRRETHRLGSRIRVGAAAGPAAGKAPAEVRIWPSRGMYVTAGSVNGHPVTFLVDTGASWVAMGEALAKRLGIDYRYRGEPGVAQTANGPVRVYQVTLDRVKVGGLELRNVQGAVLEGGMGGEVLLGQSFLNRTTMVREGQALILRKRF